MTREADRRAQADMDRVAANIRSWMDENLALGGVCDFCSTPLGDWPRVLYVCRGDIRTRFEAINEQDLGVGVYEQVDNSEWYACRICDPVVAEGDPDRLVDFVIANRSAERVGTLDDDVTRIVRDQLRTLYRQFYAMAPQRTIEDEPPAGYEETTEHGKEGAP